jgi:triacylglycerol lipase
MKPWVQLTVNFAIMFIAMSSSSFAGSDTQTMTSSVILVHGFKDTSAKMQPMARYIRTAGWEVHTPTLEPSWGQATIEDLAQQLADYLDANIAQDQRVDLVGFSMGGIVCRYYLQRMGGLERVGRFISISTPHRGTVMANLVPHGFLRRPGITQLTLNSVFLQELNKDAAALGRIRFTSLWTPLDLMILPASSSRMKVGRDMTMWVAAHPLMVWEPRCIRRVEALLRE